MTAQLIAFEPRKEARTAPLTHEVVNLPDLKVRSRLMATMRLQTAVYGLWVAYLRLMLVFISTNWSTPNHDDLK